MSFAIFRRVAVNGIASVMLIIAAAVVRAPAVAAHVSNPVVLPVPKLATTHQLNWLALGDSFASGEGLPNVDQSASPARSRCERATGKSEQPNPSRAYSVVARDLVTTGRFESLQMLACSSSRNSEWAQESGVSSESKSELVTISMGADSIGLIDFIGKCVGLQIADDHLFADAAHGMSMAGGGMADDRPEWTFQPSLGCPQTSEKMKQIIDAVVGHGPDTHVSFNDTLTTPDMLAQIAQGRSLTGGHIVIVGYPQIVEDPSKWSWRTSSGNRCQRLRPADAITIRSVISYLNQQLAAAAADANGKYNGVGVEFLDAEKIYENDQSGRHALCSADPWLNPLALGSATAHDDTDTRVYRMFHPNQVGHGALGKSLAQLVDSLSWDALVTPLTEAQILNFDMPSICEEAPGRLVNGALPNLAQNHDASISTNIVFGDITGDGQNEAAVGFSCSRGGPLWPANLLVFGPGPKLLAIFDTAKIGRENSHTVPLGNPTYSDGKFNFSWLATVFTKTVDSYDEATFDEYATFGVKDGTVQVLDTFVDDGKDLLRSLVAATDVPSIVALTTPSGRTVDTSHVIGFLPPSIESFDCRGPLAVTTPNWSKRFDSQFECHYKYLAVGMKFISKGVWRIDALNNFEEFGD